jgi:hypothetical protein
MQTQSKINTSTPKKGKYPASIAKWNEERGTREGIGGTNSVMTKETIKLLEEGYTYDFNDVEACLHAGISVVTLHNYQKKHPEFVKRKELLRSSLGLKAKAVIRKDIEENDNTKLSQWYLEKRRRKEYGNIIQQDITIDNTIDNKADRYNVEADLLLDRIKQLESVDRAVLEAKDVTDVQGAATIVDGVATYTSVDDSCSITIRYDW